MKLKWLGHASFLLEGELVVYIDPWKLENAKDLPKADLILLTHSHYDHYSLEDIEAVSTDYTVVFGTPDTKGSEEFAEFHEVRPRQEFGIGELNVISVRAYNTTKPFHPKENEWVGYLLEVGGKRIFIAGDCDAIDEHRKLGDIDVAVVPVSGTYVMTADEAARDVIEHIKPKVAVPCHYGAIVGTEKDAKEFVDFVSAKGIDGVLPQKGKTFYEF